MDYRDYNDNEVLSYIYENNEDAREILYKKYEPLIYSTATKYFKYCKSSGVELNDLVQEGMVGFTNAIDSFDESKEAMFYTYAKICIERKMASLVSLTRRKGNYVLNSCISFDDLEMKQNILLDNSFNPEMQVIDKEQTEQLLSEIKELLTDFEIKVLELKISGFSYKEISCLLDKDTKAIDNALQRIKIKVKKKLNN